MLLLSLELAIRTWSIIPGRISWFSSASSATCYLKYLSTCLLGYFRITVMLGAWAYGHTKRIILSTLAETRWNYLWRAISILCSALALTFGHWFNARTLMISKPSLVLHLMLCLPRWHSFIVCCVLSTQFMEWWLSKRTKECSIPGNASYSCNHCSKRSTWYITTPRCTTCTSCGGDCSQVYFWSCSIIIHTSKYSSWWYSLWLISSISS